MLLVSHDEALLEKGVDRLVEVRGARLHGGARPIHSPLRPFAHSPIRPFAHSPIHTPHHIYYRAAALSLARFEPLATTVHYRSNC